MSIWHYRYKSKLMLLFVCLFLHKLASNNPGMNWAPTIFSIDRILGSIRPTVSATLINEPYVFNVCPWSLVCRQGYITSLIFTFMYLDFIENIHRQRYKHISTYQCIFFHKEKSPLHQVHISKSYVTLMKVDLG